MSESEILPFQDANGDGLNDACDDRLKVIQPKECPGCTPNSAALVPNWQTKDQYEPFLNEKRCYYQITIKTKYTSTLANVPGIDTGNLTEAEAKESLDSIYDEYVYIAIEALLNYYDKATTAGIQALVYDMIERTDWDLNVRKFGRLKLLYSVPADEFDALPPAEEEDEDADSLGGEVTFSSEELDMLLLQVRKGLWLYARNLKIYRKVENSNILFVNDNSVFNLDEYGDWGISPNASRLAKLLSELDAFLNDRGFNLLGAGGFFNDFANNKRIVSQLTFTFDKRELTKLVIEAAGCREEPITYTGKLILLKKPGSVWTNKTAINYLINLRDMATDLTARSPTPWIDFLIEYTFPAVYTTANSQYDHSDQASSCLGSALAEEGKQLGEDILDEVFSLGDAIAYQFHQQACAKSTEELQAVKEEMSLYLSPYQVADTDTPAGEQRYDYGTQTSRGQPLYHTSGTPEKVKQLALEQAYAEIDANDEMYGDFCLWMFGQADDENRMKMGIAAFEDLTANFHRLKLCGLLDMLTEAIQCLLGGLSLEEAMGKMIQAALKGMSINNLSDLFVGLPPDKQNEIAGLVQEKLESGDIFREGPNKAAFDDAADNYYDESEEEEEEVEAAVQESATPTQAEYDYWPTTGDWSQPRLSVLNMGTADLKSMVDNSLGPDKTVEQSDWSRWKEDNFGGSTYGEWSDQVSDPEGSLAPGFLAKASDSASQLSSDTIVGAYIQAIMEVYIGDELSLIDLLGNFPGAPIVSKILATMQCPVPAFFNPAVVDMFKDWQLPICTNMKKIAWPQLMIPPRHKFKDLWLFLKNAIKLALAQLMQKILVMLVMKLCEIMSKAVCNSLELLGGLAKAAISRENTLTDIIKESICGDNVDDEQLRNTVNDLFDSFGNGAGAFGDQDALMDFTMDLSSAVTQNEMTNAFLGESSPEFLAAASGLIENEYPQFSEAFGDKQSIAKAFENMGNVMPTSFKDSLRDSLSPAGDTAPSNPTLCATPADLEQFCENRAALLEGRASPGQIKKHCDDFRQGLADDLEDLAPLMNDLPGYISSNMPPLVSDPGCDNGIMPYEPELVTEAVSAAMGSDLEQLQIAYSDDMLGNGPGKKNWGLLNMILSDTMGQPLTTHHRKTSNQEKRVDFYKNWTWAEMQPQLEEIMDLAVAAGGGFVLNPVLGIMSLVPLVNSLPRPIEDQRGAYPLYVGEWLREQINAMDISYNFNNDVPATNRPEMFSSSFNSLIPNYSPYGKNKVNYLALPDFGYNVKVFPRYEERYVEFVKIARKNTPDLTLSFRDNAKGIKSYEFAYGFDMEVYLADLAPNQTGSLTPKITSTSLLSNRAEVIKEPEITIINPSDSTRVKIYNVLNPNADLDNADLQLVPSPASVIKKMRKDGTTIKERMYEFMTVENTFDGIDLDGYPTFRQSFVNYSSTPPQALLLKEIINDESIASSTFETALKSITEVLHSKVRTDIYDNENAWLYGATFDDLSFSDGEYVIPDNTPLVSEEYWGGLYQDAEITNSDPDAILGPTRQIVNDDMILGVSRMQYEIEKGTYRVAEAENRVFYLDPIQYGGRYMNPPVYIKPLFNKGWLGLVDVLFPEISVCKPSLTDLIDFEDLQARIDDLYSTMSDDERLAQDPECVREAPYNRILDRSSKAFIRGLVPAAIRIYCSVHIIKALSVFTKFMPKFPDVCSPIFASYIIESMEKSFKDAQGAGWELFTLFKDEEFWYAFLEQAVETYADQVESEEVDPPAAAQIALTRLNKMQAEYIYPNKEDLKEAKENREVFMFKLLKHYRSEENLEAVQATEEDAKLILQELVIEQLNFMGKKIIKNLDVINMMPDIKDISYYILDNFTLDSNLTLNDAVDVDGSFETIYPDLPIVPYDESEDEDVEEPYYTDGGEFVVADYSLSGKEKGDEYVGYYHVHTDEDTGNIIYMEGEYHSSEAHAVLEPVVNLLQVPIGDVPDINSTSASIASDSDYDKPFLVEKYISINGVKYAPDDAVSIVKENSKDSLLAAIYPGTIEIVKDADGNPVGLTGEMGVRYGLRFSVFVEGTYYEITSVEIDALDRPISKFTTLSANSGLLACLINHLREDEAFKLVIGYIFPIKKMISIMAIYADMGLLASIGEETVEDGATWASNISFAGAGSFFDPENKPGMYVDITTKKDEDGDDVIDVISIEGKPGWTSFDDRNVWSVGFMEWDEWDQELLRNSKARIKKLFKSNYNDREFNIKDLSSPEIGRLHMKKLKAALKFPAGQRILPRFRWKNIRSNPFNANGDLCEKEE